MGRPPGNGDDEFGDREFEARYEMESEGRYYSLPDVWKQDQTVIDYVDNLFESNDWDEAHRWHDILQDYITEYYGVDFDDYFNWNEWREEHKDTEGRA